MIQDQLIDSLAANLISSKQAGVAVELYNSCTDRTQSGRAFAAMNDLFRLWTIGRWPTDALASMRDVWSFAGELLRDVGLNALVDVHVAVHSEDPTKVAIGLKRPSFLFSCNDATRPAVINMLQDALVETMVAVARSANQQLIDEVMQVITRLSSSPLEPPVSETGMRGFSVVRLSDMDPGIVDLLKATFGNDSSLGKETKVVLKSADFLQGHLVEALRELPPRALMNYLGFLVFINLAPFFLDRHRLLRQLFSKSVLGRTLPDVSNTGRLCLVAVERVLPGCFAKISSQYFRASGGIVANKLSQLVTSFGRNVEHLAWMDDMAAVLSRYLLKEFATTPSSNDTAFCPTSFTSYAGDSSVKFFVAVSRDRQRRLLRPLTKSDGGDMATMSRSQLLTTATYDAPRRRLHVPAALFNVSVPANTSHFSLHFARFAVRFYGAVVEALLHRDAVQPSLRYSDDLQRRFEDLLGCFEWELRQLPAGLSHSADAPYSVTARGAFLQQTVAVQLAFRAFQEAELHKLDKGILDGITDEAIDGELERAADYNEKILFAISDAEFVLSQRQQSSHLNHPLSSGSSNRQAETTQGSIGPAAATQDQVNEHIDQLLALSPVNTSRDVEKLRQLQDTVRFHVSALESLGVTSTQRC
ncbi:hypothetical protein HPB49_007518 [Dermacentor silvarum]|uniref:Uncharacterized protein n=1 Tax=Dermacentor silvarum TaxID=543639 RepID=A0ACB8DBH3_DERSI|nr:hypothetical protein HPB49_007518 [Dermacentor silvarum]